MVLLRSLTSDIDQDPSRAKSHAGVLGGRELRGRRDVARVAPRGTRLGLAGRLPGSSAPLVARQCRVQTRFQNAANASLLAKPAACALASVWAHASPLLSGL